MELELVEILQGSFNIIFVVISLLIGIRLILKYFEKRNREYLLVGITWIGISTPWMHGAISFVMIILMDTSLSDETRFIIGNAFIPVVVVIWLVAFTDLFYKDKQKLILIIFNAIAICFEVIFFTLLFTDPSLIGTFPAPFHARYTLFIRIMMSFYAGLALITGVIFAVKTIKAGTSPEMKLRGKFLLIAFPSFAIGAFLDVFVLLTPITVVIIRLILISSAIEFYCGFSLPNILRKLFLKQE